MSRQVVALRPEVVEVPAGRAGLHDELDNLEAAALEARVLYADVRLQLALARHLVETTGRLTLGPEPTVAQVHAARLLANVISETHRLVLEHSERRRRR